LPGSAASEVELRFRDEGGDLPDLSIVIGRRPVQARFFHGLGHPLVRVNFRTQSLICDGKLSCALDHYALDLFTVSQQGGGGVGAHRRSGRAL
jgi:hypothetical protein